jgi:heme exporter protein C
MIVDQHWAQKIFYVHVPSAWVGFVGYLIVMISGFMLFIKNDNRWDDVALASAEIGTFFMALVLITGPVWAKPIWGTPWIWEPRLTTTLILFLYYMGYFMFRSFGGNIERVRRQAAALGIIAFINVPIIFLSVQFWEPEIQSHPQVEMASQPPEILYSFLFSLTIFSILFAVMLQYRVHLIRTKNLLKSNV